jgi:hypothetical protein
MNGITYNNTTETGWEARVRVYGFCLLLLGLLLGFIPKSTTAQTTRQINVPSDVLGQLEDSLAVAPAGSVLNLIDVGPYEIDTTLVNTVPITIQADPGLSVKPKIVMLITGSSMFAPRADLTLTGLDLVGINAATNDTTRRFVRIGAPVTQQTDLDIVVRDCWLHDALADMIRTEVDFGSLILDEIFAYEIGDRTIDMRAGRADSLIVTKSTFYRMHDKFRLRGSIETTIFDAVTIANTQAGTGIELFTPGLDATIRNTLIVNCKGGSFTGGDTLNIEYSNFYQDPTRVILPLINPASMDTAMSAANLPIYMAGTGNITRGSDPVADQGEDPVFADSTNRNFAVSVFSQSAFGSSEGIQIGDPRWGTYTPLAVTDKGESLPELFALHQNYPNPLRASGFASLTEIRYELPRPAEVRLSIHNLLGQEIIRLIDARQQPGIHRMAWNGRDARNRLVKSGTYFYRLQAGDFVQIRKLLFLQ